MSTGSGTAFVTADGMEIRRCLAEQLVVRPDENETDERALKVVGSIIRQAYSDAYGPYRLSENDERGGHFSRDEALHWLSSASEATGSFRWCCELVNADPDRIAAAFRRRRERT